VISDIAFGKSLGNLEADQDVWSFIKTVQDSTPLVIFLAIFPGLSKIFFSRLCKRFWPKVTDSDGLGKLMAYVLLLRGPHVWFVLIHAPI
jgi:hypothetical protein